jgi:hypothetical protein
MKIFKFLKIGSKPFFISKPNKCEGCPIKDTPLRFKISNSCHKAQLDYEVEYGLNDLGQTICRVFRRIKDSA